ncbi:ABC transporter ATP-binding protein [Sinomonas sp. ASV322]|uniref:ABC transporter ATP-binding protein n=1 Tax=Sinomonas sp. ASV322 TaxID=3041920 RepID=UPI0027DBA05D|nr:ABC transporter ATP-binding protein [Sinomonas sp. ASV322]MDQ4502603.1 ABC transporter ATP-binding protein [Sinomonas sp. ASV322]
MPLAASGRAYGAQLDGGRPAAVELRHVSVRYSGLNAGDHPALADLSLRIEPGETVALLGPSGSGKSTALKAIAGFERPSEGHVLLAGKDVTNRPPAERGIGVVVQSYALFPHLKVADNVAYGLRARRVPRAEVRARVSEMLEMVGMEAHARKLPRELSGGQQQRIAIARALAIRPDVLLLDEPLSALDARMRQDMLEELARLRRELPDVAMVYVTHDQTEALALADRIGVMRDGRLVDLGTADELYHRPRHAFTASFLGGANLLQGVVEPLGAASLALGAAAAAGSQAFVVRLDTGGAVSARVGDPAFDAGATGGRVSVAVRPHAFRVQTESRAAGLRGTVESVQWRGAGHRLRVRLTGIRRGGSAMGDAGMGDAGRVDAGMGDAGRVDAGMGDVGRVDVGMGDAGRVDAGMGDAGQTVAVDLEPFAAVPEVGAAVALGVVPGEAVIVPRDGSIGGLRVPGASGSPHPARNRAGDGASAAPAAGDGASS